MKVLRNFSRITVGLIFIFSGFVKLIDPLGSTYKFIDYFSAMNLEFLEVAALPLAIIMCMAELIIGLMLLINILPRLGAWGVLFFMLAFTPLTLWIALTDPVQDCGCFGDAVIFTNWETFYKNIFIMALTIIIFIQRKKFKPYFTRGFQWILITLFVVSSFLLSIYCLNNLPILDFRPFHIGANISEGMIIPEHERENVDIYESSFIYEKDGVRQSFKETELPDASWTFIDAEHKLIKKGYEPPIHNFVISKMDILPTLADEFDAIGEDTFINLFEAEFIFHKDDSYEVFSIDNLPDNSWIFDEVVHAKNINPDNIQLIYINMNTGSEKTFKINSIPDNSWIFIDAEYSPITHNSNQFTDGADITDFLLEDENYSFMLILPEIDKTNTDNLLSIKAIADFCIENNIEFYCITGSTKDKVLDFAEKNDFYYNFYSADPVTLKTIVRSNPGLVLLKKGTVYAKWSNKNIPEINDLNKELSAMSISKLVQKKDNSLIWNYIFILLLFVIAVCNIQKLLVKNKLILNR